jgi:hypothetical protein
MTDFLRVTTAGDDRLGDRNSHNVRIAAVVLGTALILSKDIDEAARVLSNVATKAHLFPRLTKDLHAARGQLQPWANTHAVKTLDAQLHTYGLTPGQKI